ncbi:hypothetical protein OEZ85_011824 [Tetradesmus obliquus]|uniref:J domain-containing protein n=1 Tax=Tetradesmus obliquus TaxID=3088 RepID=A0ABY8TRH0_TETOB|nr:hypothetical protein OEZ85_011824 [Tetradesmus obliquus]
MHDPVGLYAALGLSPQASAGEVKRAFRTLRTKAHPDKGGDAEQFNALVKAHSVLSDPEKRRLYDETGQVHKSAGEAFVEGFAGGAFSDRVGRATAAATSIASSMGVADQITIRQSESQQQSHTAGFEAWLRSRGSSSSSVYTSETIAEQFGVVKASYEAVPLQQRSVLAAVCRGPGKPQERLEMAAQQLPSELEWGEVLIEVKYAPVTPADIYTVRLGGVYDEDSKEPPFVAGHDAVAVVAQVGPGVKELAEGDVVLPVVPLLGCWAEGAVVKAKAVARVGRLAAGAAAAAAVAAPEGAAADAAGTKAGAESATQADELPLPLEYLAAHRELLLAFKLLEADASLKPGDCVILNVPNSTVGRTVLQLCKLLKLRAVAVLRCKPSSEGADERLEAVAEQLRGLGATLVLRDEGSVKTQLQAHRFFGRPKLAFDAVGGDSAGRIAEALEPGSKLVVYGCLSGKAPSWPWQAWVFRGLQVSGFNLRKALAADTPAGAAKLRKHLASLGQLVSAGLLSLEFTEYGFAEEWQEALEHAIDAPGGSRVLLRM